MKRTARNGRCSGLCEDHIGSLKLQRTYPTLRLARVSVPIHDSLRSDTTVFCICKAIIANQIRAYSPSLAFPLHSVPQTRDLLGANRGPRPSTDGSPHAKFPAVHSKDHILDSIILLI